MITNYTQFITRDFRLLVVGCIMLLSAFISRQASAAAYSSSSVTQITGNVLPGSTDQQIIRVFVDGSSSGFGLNWQIASCSFVMNNTNNANVTSAKLWMNSSNSFSGATQVGSTVNNPTGTISFTVNSGNIGDNDRYLFLTFNISSGAPCTGNFVDASVPSSGLVITGNNGGSKTPSSNNPSGNRQIFLQVVPSVTITAPGGTSGCSGTVLDFTASAVNGGTTPAYQWKVNGINAGTNSTGFSSGTLSNNDQVTCVLTSNATCANPSSIASNAINVAITSNPRPRIFPSDTVVCTGSYFTIVARDTGAYAGGYPPGTLFDYGFGPTPDSAFFVNGPGIFTCTVTLPAGFGFCSGVSNVPNLYYIDAPVAILTADTILCNGESNASVYAQIFLGTIPFHYQWYHNGALVRDVVSAEAFDTLQNVGMGSYCLVVTDTISGVLTSIVCASDSACIDVLGPMAYGVSLVKSDVSCQGGNDGAVNLTVTGGTPPYTYAWSNGETTEDISQLTTGTYTVNVTDFHGCSTSTIAFILTTADIIPPVLNCPANIFVNTLPGECNATVTFVTPVGADNCPGVNTIQAAGLPSGSVFPIGMTIETFIATDSVGNLTICSFIITVIDAQPPVITCPADISVNNDPGACNALVTYVVPSALDGCSPVTVIQTGGLPPGSLFPIGTTVNTFKATDGSGNFTTCSFIVIVIDNVLPVISCAPDTQLVNSPGANGAFYSYSVSASDNCSASILQTAGLPGGALFPVGTTLNTFVATDPSGNNVTCGFTVTVSDNEVPVVIAQDISLVLDANGTVNITPEMVDGGCHDNCGIAIKMVTPENFSCANVGDNVVVLSITDIHGNSATDTAIVTISSSVSADIAPDPVQLCQGNSVNLTGNPSGGSGSYAIHQWTGNNALLSDTLLENPDFIGTQTGVFDLTYIVTDNHGCIGSDNVTIEVFPTLVTGVSGTHVSCFSGNDGSATVSISGGSGNVSYLWSNGSTTATINNLIAGTYDVSVSDAANCFANLSFTVTEPAILAVSTTSTSSGCGGASDGSATVTAVGGAGSYSYLWNNGQTTEQAIALSPAVYTVTVTDVNGCSQTASATVTPLTITLGITSTLYNGGYNLTCSGGSNGIVDLSIISGVGPFTYLWSTGETTEDISGLTAGSYTVTVSNGICQSSDQITIVEPPVISLVTTKTNITCNGAHNGTATVVASGGVGEFTYSWNTTPVKTTAVITNLGPTMHTVIVMDANGCQKSKSVTITQPTPVSASGVFSGLQCKGDANGNINLTAAGGTPPYTYLWNGGITTEDRTGLKAKSYTVTVTDANGCTKKTTFTLIEPGANLTLLTTKTNVRCFNGATGIAGISATGGVAPYAYSWNTIPVKTTTTVSGLLAGTYTCTVTDAAGCVKSATVAITQPVQLVLTTSQSNVTTNGGNNGTASVSPSGGSPGYTYSWNTVPPKTTASINNLVAGSYTVKVTDSKGCTKTAVVVITQPSPRTQVNTARPEMIFKVYPNPSGGIISVAVDHLSERELTVHLYDLIGNLVFKDRIDNSSGSFTKRDYDFGALPKGIYMIELTAGSSRKVAKIILQ